LKYFFLSFYERQSDKNPLISLCLDHEKHSFNDKAGVRLNVFRYHNAFVADMAISDEEILKILTTYLTTLFYSLFNDTETF